MISSLRETFVPPDTRIPTEDIAAKPTDARAQFVAKYMIVPAAKPKASGRIIFNCSGFRFFFDGRNRSDLLDLIVTTPKPTKAPHSAAAISDIAVAKLFKQRAG